MRKQVEIETKHTVDMSYYGLTTAAFCSALPELEIGYFVGMERLVIRGN